MKYIAYYRVSTKRQGIDGNGMEAQKQAVSKFLSTIESELIAEFSEVESGGNNDRPKLAAAIQLAKTRKATLIIAKLDRISRNASFLLQLQDSGVSFTCCDMPNADKFTVGILALVAQREKELISARTIAGLAVARQRGARLGNPNAAEAWQKAIAAIRQNRHDFAQTAIKSIREIQSAGVTSLNKIADCMTKRGEKTRRGGKWSATAVSRILACS